MRVVAFEQGQMWHKLQEEKREPRKSQIVEGSAIMGKLLLPEDIIVRTEMVLCPFQRLREEFRIHTSSLPSLIGSSAYLYHNHQP